MKIAIVSVNLDWQAGGCRLIFELAQSLKKEGNEVVVYSPEFKGTYFKELWTGLDIRVVPPLGPFVWTRPRSFLGWMWSKLTQEYIRHDASKRIAAAMDDNFDIVNVHDAAYPVAYFYKKKNPRTKVIWTENDPPFVYLPKATWASDFLSRSYNGWKERSSKKYFAAIDDVTIWDAYNRKWCDAHHLRATTVRFGADFEKFYMPVKDFAPVARQKKIRLFGLGSLNQYRHYEEILLAVNFLRKWGYDATALIIANDAWDEKEYRAKLLAIVHDNHLEPYVDMRFVGVPEEGLKDAYRASDVFVYPMYIPAPRNGFGFSIGVFEAMAAGLLLIVCNTTTSTEELEDGKNALFVDPMSPEQIAEKAKFLIENPAQYDAIARAGQEVVKTKLTWENYVKGFLALFK